MHRKIVSGAARAWCRRWLAIETKEAETCRTVIVNDAGDDSWSSGSRVGAVGTASASVNGSVGSDVVVAADMERTIEEAHCGRGHYVVGSRWHEPVLEEQ